jgi:hypothetical protein
VQAKQIFAVHRQIDEAIPHRGAEASDRIGLQPGLLERERQDRLMIGRPAGVGRRVEAAAQSERPAPHSGGQLVARRDGGGARQTAGDQIDAAEGIAHLFARHRRGEGAQPVGERRVRPRQ